MYIVFVAREKSRTEDKKTFANIVLLHAEVYYHMRLSNGSRLKILAEPLIYYLGDLMEDGIEENIYFITIQVSPATCANKRKVTIVRRIRFSLRYSDLVKICTHRVQSNWRN